MGSKKNHTSRLYRIKAGITIGDPSGIGPAITAKALSELEGFADFTVIGDKWVFNRASEHRISSARFIDLNNVNHKNFKFGKVKAEYGRASIEYLNKALELINDKQIDCLITCPVSKEAVNLAGFKFTGHTEYLAERTNTEDFAMLLLNKELKIGLLTRHIPLRDVPFSLDKDKIYKTILLTYFSLKRLFSIKAPRIAVCGLNPHASDNGFIGDEEKRIIEPAIKRIRTRIRGIDGPLPADAAIVKTIDKKYDCSMAAYHDQALIALKVSGDASAVNITLGLPFIRTSPLHGTAFDIAGTNLARADSLIEAIKLAVKCASNLKNA